MTGRKTRLTFEHPRELLLVEVARRCRACDAPARIGLTKSEARDYTGFECEACDERNDDELSESDIPEWWEELRVTGLSSLRPRADDHARSNDEEPEAVKRLSDAWGAVALKNEAAARDSSAGGGVDSSDGSSGIPSPGDPSEGSF